MTHLKITISNILKSLMEKMDLMQEQMGNFSREGYYKKMSNTKV